MQRQVIDLLARDIRQKNAVLFVGAGLSTAAGLPSWLAWMAPLAAQVGKSLNPSSSSGHDLLNIASIYEGAFGRNALIQRLRQDLDTTTIDPTPLHKELLEIFSQLVVITTNYDNLLEKCCQANWVPYHVVTSDDELAYWDSSRTTLLKLRGDASQPDSLVVTRRDYDTHPLRYPLLYERLKATFATSTILFVGYSHSDPDLDLVQHQLSHQLGVHSRHAYTVQFDMSPQELQDWTYLHPAIKVIPLDTANSSKSGALAAYLNTLRSAI